jgi:hypothetical protein
MITARCWGHADPVENPLVWRGTGYEPERPTRSYTVTHEFTAEQAVRLIEFMSFEDWEDGPRCLLAVLAEDDGTYEP